MFPAQGIFPLAVTDHISPPLTVATRTDAHAERFFCFVHVITSHREIGYFRLTIWCTIWSMARREVLVQLDDDLVSRLDHLASERGTSRSELLRNGAIAVLEAADLASC